MIRPHRQHPLWFAFILHRVSGLLLALFLPLHFWVLSLALTDTERLDRLLSWTATPGLKAVEVGLVFCLAVHMFGGLRLLALEFLPWTSGQKTAAAGAVGLSVFVSLTFLLQAT